jgi:hypothetical protein
MVVMSVLRVTCTSCRRGWFIAGNISIYFQLDLVSHPCPYCEAYALSCADVSRRSREGRRPVSGEKDEPRPSGQTTADGVG